MFAVFLQRFSFVGWLRYWLFYRNYNTSIKAILIGICIVFTIFSALLIRDIDLSQFPSVLKSFILIVIMLVLTVSISMYRNMQAAALTIFLLSTLVNEGVNTGTGTKLTFTFLSLCLWVVVWLFRKLIVDRSFSLRPSFSNWPILLFIVTVFLSYLWSGAFVESRASYLFAQKSLVRLMTAIVLVISPLTLVLFSNVFRSERAFKIFTWWLVGLGLAMGAIRLLTGTVPYPVNTKGQFPTWFIAFALGQIFFNKAVRWPLKITLLVGVGIWLQITLGLGLTWLSGWLPVVVVIIALLAFYSRKLLVFVTLCVVIWGVANADFVNERFSGEQSESGGTRSTAWARAFGVVGKHFLFGAGPAGYEYYFQVYGYYQGSVGTADLSHNNYIDIIAQTGVVGFSLWIALWLGQGLMVWKLVRKRFENSFLTALKYSLVACYPAILVSMMLGDWVTPFPYTQTLAGIDYTIWAWMISGLTVALYYFTTNSQSQPNVVEPSAYPLQVSSSAL